jgi:shikimate dehydrogenase
LKLFAVTGKPVFHSKSPVMFNGAFRSSGINASYLKLAADSAGEALRTAKSIGISGLNVTSPFKEDIMNYIDDLSDESKKIGAVNTVVIKNGKTTGYNTDFFGVTGALTNAGVELQGRKAVVSGAGGAGRAAAFGLKQAGADVVLINRTPGKAEKAADDIGCRFALIGRIEEEVSRADILVSCVTGSSRILNTEALRKNLVVLDANYRESSLIADVEKAGCKIIHPLNWLLYQAIPAFELFVGTSPDVQIMRESLYETSVDDKNNIALIGFMGTGKTFAAHETGLKTGMNVVDLDTVIENQAGRTITDIFKNDGEIVFREIESEMLKKVMTENNQVISCGGGVVLSAENRKILRSNSAIVWLWAGLEKILQRTDSDNNRPLLETEDRRAKIEKLLKERIHLYAETADLIINTEEHKPDEIAGIIVDEICKKN